MSDLKPFKMLTQFDIFIGDSINKYIDSVDNEQLISYLQNLLTYLDVYRMTISLMVNLL